MDGGEQQDLEKFIHERLNQLPEKTAPESLVVDVLARIAAQKELPWWKQSFMAWPRGIQTALIVALSCLTGAVVCWASEPANQISSSIPSAQSFGWMAQMVDALVAAMRLTLKNLTWQWFAGVAALFVVMYGACLAGGMALYRVTTHGRRG